jgi:hypothetical protein
MNSPSNNEPGLPGELRSDAQQLGSTAKNRVYSELDARKGDAASQARSASSVIERAASELDQGSPEWLRSTFQQGARQIQRFADTLEQKDSRQLFNDVRTFARDNPTTFLSACAAAGFAAARLFKAGAPESSSDLSAPNQGPPPQMDEPMFRASSPDATAQPAGGEFV